MNNSDTNQAEQLNETAVISSVFDKENFLKLISKIGFRVSGKAPFSILIDKDSLNTKIRVGNDGIEFKNSNASFCFFFEYGKNKITYYKEENFISISNEDESMFVNLYGF